MNMLGDVLKAEFIFVVGPFSSGTTAVTGMIMRLGALHLEPLSTTNDPRTPSSLESVMLQQLTNYMVNESILSLKINRDHIPYILEDFKNGVLNKFSGHPELTGKKVVFKRATTALFLDEIKQVFQPKFVFVYRNHDDIEKTRVRRGWYDCHGKWGAAIIDQYMNDWRKQEQDLNILPIDYEDIQDNPIAMAHLLNDHLELQASEENIQNAARWVESHQKNFSEKNKRV